MSVTGDRRGHVSRNPPYVGNGTCPDYVEESQLLKQVFITKSKNLKKEIVKSEYDIRFLFCQLFGPVMLC